ncbi:MAG: DoxX family protein [Rhodospirillales bacterium]|nr:DoxX family protein [Rhodospirillales bacterium]
MFIQKIEAIHADAVEALHDMTDGWFMGLMARFVFASVLLVFFLNSAATKLGSGFPGILMAKAGAYAQILPSLAEAVGYDTSKIAFIPWGLIVHLGAYGEALIPVMIVLGLFTRLASFAMIGFIAVMTYVDIWSHGIGEKAVGGMFDRVQDSIVSDQRLLWIFPLIYLAIHGAGSVSFDRLLRRFSSISR